MFSQALMVSLRILAFRAGPQDFPYSPQLTQVIAPLAVAANYLVFSQVLPVAMSLAMALTAVAGIALVTRGLLRARQVEARFNQTFNALLATTTLLTLLLIPAFAQLAPKLQELAQNPALMNNPEALQLPQGAAFLMNLLNVWNFAVSTSIFRQAANARLGLGLLFAVCAALSVAFLVIVSGSFAAVLFGPHPPAVSGP